MNTNHEASVKSEQNTEPILNSNVKKRPIYAFFKRAFDIVASLLALIILSIPLLIIGIIVWCTSKGPAVFKQERVGRHSEVFTIYKFRTMAAETPDHVATKDLKDPYRYITKVGAFMRKTSLDELPQFLNILKGDMSFIGPRPVIPEETRLLELRRAYGADQVRPGLIGLAQIRGRDTISIQKKALFDGQYAHHCTLGMDLRILFCAIPYVLKREGFREGSRRQK